MKYAAAVMLVLALTAGGGANAQQFDLSTMSCDSFIKMDKDTMKLITVWMAGYYTEETETPALDLPKINDLQDRLVKFCTRETTFPIKTAADGIFGH